MRARSTGAREETIMKEGTTKNSLERQRKHRIGNGYGVVCCSYGLGNTRRMPSGSL